MVSTGGRQGTNYCNSLVSPESLSLLLWDPDPCQGWVGECRHDDITAREVSVHSFQWSDNVQLSPSEDWAALPSVLHSVMHCTVAAQPRTTLDNPWRQCVPRMYVNWWCDGHHLISRAANYIALSLTVTSFVLWSHQILIELKCPRPNKLAQEFIKETEISTSQTKFFK